MVTQSWIAKCAGLLAASWACGCYGDSRIVSLPVRSADVGAEPEVPPPVATFEVASTEYCQNAVEAQSAGASKKLGDFAKCLIGAGSEAESSYLLDATDEATRHALVDVLREHYRSAGDGVSRLGSQRALARLGRYSVAHVPEFGQALYQDAAQTMRFMNRYVRFAGDVPQPKDRDAAQWSGETVLVEGDFNGCVEAAKLFMVLWPGSPDVEMRYVSSFSLERATRIIAELGKPEGERDEDLIRNPPGHAVVELRDPTRGDVLLVDPSRFLDAYFGVTLVETDLDGSTWVGDLEVPGRVLQHALLDVWVRREGAEVDVTAYRWGNFGGDAVSESRFPDLPAANAHLRELLPSPSHPAAYASAGILLHEWWGEMAFGGGVYVIFDKSEEPPFWSQYGAEGSSPATLDAILQYFSD